MRKRQAKLTGTARSEQKCKPRVDMRQRVAALLRFGWQASNGMGGRLRRFTHPMDVKRRNLRYLPSPHPWNRRVEFELKRSLYSYI